MHGFRAFDGIQHAIDARSGDGSIGGIAGNIGFIDLHTVADQISRLSGQSVGDGHVERGEVVVMRVQQRAGEHVGAGERELERSTSHFARTGAVFGQIEHAFGDGTAHDGGRLAAEGHLMLGAKRGGVFTAHAAVDAAELVDEILNHAVRVGMIDIEAVQLPVRRQINACLALRVEDDACGVDHSLFARQRGKPVWNRVGADGGCLDHP